MNSKLPKSIIESINQNPIGKWGGLEGSAGEPSVLETMPQAGLEKLMASKRLMDRDKFTPPPVKNYYGEQKNQQQLPLNENFENINNEYDLDDGKPLPDLAAQYTSKRKSMQPLVNEQQNYQPQPQVFQPNVSGIDYGLINTMLKAIIAEEFKNINNKFLTEGKTNDKNTGEIILMTENSIKFVTKSGNIYEGKLKLAGNINNK